LLLHGRHVPQTYKRSCSLTLTLTSRGEGMRTGGLVQRVVMRRETARKSPPPESEFSCPVLLTWVLRGTARKGRSASCRAGRIAAPAARLAREASGRRRSPRRRGRSCRAC